MAIKIRCSRCTKRISIDEAFAGGVCRCPYCTAINNVPLHGEPGVSAVTQPQAQAAKVSGKAASIPIAERVGFQGVAAIFLIAALLAMLIGGVVVAVHFAGNGEPGGNGDPDGSGMNGASTNPFVSADLPSVAGNLPVTSPVVYVVHANLDMEEAYGYVCRMIDASSVSLGEGQAAVVIHGDGGAEVVTGGLVAASTMSLYPAERIEWAWGNDVGVGLSAAMDLNPATVVLFARDWAKQTDEVVDRAKQANIRIVTVVPGASGTMAESMARLAQATGGSSRAFTLSELSALASGDGS